MMRFLPAILFATSLALGSAATAAPVFSDDFEDADISDWTFSDNGFGSNIITQDTVVASNGTRQFPGSSRAMRMELNPNGTAVGSTVVRATREITIGSGGEYTLDLLAASTSCSGCVISYDVIFGPVSGGNLVNIRSQSVGSFASISEVLALSAGTYELTLGMHTTNASSGTFIAYFDDVALTAAVPVPASALFLLSGAVALAGVGRRRLSSARSV